MSNLSVAYPFSRSKTSRNIEYERFTAISYKQPAEYMRLTPSMQVLWMYVSEFIGSNPTESKEIEDEGFIDTCSMTGWITCKEISSQLVHPETGKPMPVDTVKEAKNRLVKLGWIRQVWFQNNNRSGIFQIGIPQAKEEAQTTVPRSRGFSHNTTYSNIDLNTNSPLSFNSNSKPNAKNIGDVTRFEKPKSKSISHGDLNELNFLFAEATNQKPDKARKQYWSSCWHEVVPRIRSAVKFRFKVELSYKNAVNYLKLIIPKMEGKCQLARYPTWFIKTRSNGQENQPTWGLDFVFKHYHKRHLLEPTDEKFWFHLDRHKAPIIPIPDQQKLRRGKIKTDKQLPGLSWIREEAVKLDLSEQLTEDQAELVEAIQALKERLNNEGN
jgi:hypothetical protein